MFFIFQLRAGGGDVSQPMTTRYVYFRKYFKNTNVYVKS